MAAAREVREETGLEPTVGDPLVVVDQQYVDDERDRVAVSARYVLYAATAEGPTPTPDELGVAADEIRTAPLFDDLPARLHDGDLLRPYLRGPP